MFKLKYANDRGSINLKIDENVDSEDIQKILDFVSSSLVKEKTTEDISITTQTPHYYSGDYDAENNNDLQNYIKNKSFSGRQLGEKPSSEFHMGSYKEPDNGLVIKMLHHPEEKYIAATKIIRGLTSLPVKSCADIVAGNCICPVLSEEVAEKIMEEFKKINVYAKTVPVTKYSASA